MTVVVAADSLTKRFGEVSAVTDLSSALEAGTITGRITPVRAKLLRTPYVRRRPGRRSLDALLVAASGWRLATSAMNPRARLSCRRKRLYVRMAHLTSVSPSV